MKKKEDISKYKHSNGYLFSKEVFDSEVTRQVFREYIEYNGIEQVAKGIYIFDDAMFDFYYVLSERNKRAVFSHESALFLNNLMEHEPKGMTVTIPRGYNASHLREKGITIISKAKEIYELGITTVKTNFGNNARVYDIDRTICDIIKYKSKIDIQIFTYALKEYIKRKDKNLINLIEYAKKMKIEEEVRKYIEVLI